MSSWAQRGAEQLLTPTPSPHPQAPTQPEAMHRRRRRRRAAGRRQFRRRMLRRHRRCHRHRLVTATAICAAPESASPRRFCRSAAIAEAAVKSSPDAAAAAAIAAPVTEATAPAAATVSGSRIPAAAGVGRAPGAGRPGQRKNGAQQSFSGPQWTQNAIFGALELQK